MPPRTTPLHNMVLIPETASNIDSAGRLGRHIHFDERSRKFAAVDGRKRKSTPSTSVSHKRMVKAFNQGNTGSCTGNAAVGCAATQPLNTKGGKYNEKAARTLYSLASTLDNIQGQFPPNDTGSTVLAAMKAGVQEGLWKQYRWCFGIQDVQLAIPNSAIDLGVNWYSSFDQIDANGIVRLTKTAKIRGGHSFEMAGIHYDTSLGAPGSDLVECWQSWGPWGPLAGKFFFPLADLDRLLKEDGEAAQPGGAPQQGQQVEESKQPKKPAKKVVVKKATRAIKRTKS